MYQSIGQFKYTIKDEASMLLQDLNYNTENDTILCGSRENGVNRY